MASHQSGESDALLRERRTHGYETARADIQAHVPLSSQRILELGCSAGALGDALKRRNGANVLGVEIDAEYATAAARRLDRVVVADAQSFLAGDMPFEGPFDTLIAADTLEHLVDPWRALSHAVAWLDPGATVVVSVPNVLHWVGLLRILATRRWPRDDAGVFDRTHLRWFTQRDATELLAGAGLEVRAVQALYPGRGWRRPLSRILGSTSLRQVLAIQWIVVGVKPR